VRGRDKAVELVSGLTSPAPHLIDLSLNFAAVQPANILPDNFLGASAPSLRRLELRYCYPSWSSNIFSSSITSLKLLNPPRFGVHPDVRLPVPSTGELAEVLARLRLLTVLDLEMKLPDMSAIASDGRTFGFPHMQTLRLVGECDEISGLLSCLRLPSTACIAIKCSKADEASLLSLRCSLEKAWTTKPIVDRVSMWRYGVGGGGIVGTTTSPPTTHLDISMTSINNWQENIFPEPSNFIALMNWDHVETWSLECPLERGVDWKATLEILKQLKNFEVSGEAVPQVMKALIRLTTSPASNINFANTVPFPYLEKLMVYGVNIILNNKNLSRYGSYTRGTTVTFQDIMKWLQQRSALGVPQIKEIAFKDCSGFTSKVKELFGKLGKRFGVANVVQTACIEEIEDLDGSIYNNYDSDGDRDDDLCNACLHLSCEGECEIDI
jgi:hypothetical protein